ncbi:hypothetical protein D3C71_1640970 [compost metagenome]
MNNIITANKNENDIILFGISVFTFLYLLSCELLLILVLFCSVPFELSVFLISLILKKSINTSGAKIYIFLKLNTRLSVTLLPNIG